MIRMTMLPMYKKCPKCKKSYSWNPDVGNMWCPNCGLFGMFGEDERSVGKRIVEILKRKK